jgi:hypothetical protein
MSLVDFFNSSFLMFLGIIVLLVAILVVYFESKSREQNHKISSMFSIVSTLAEDLNNVKLGINQIVLDGFNGGSSSLDENKNFLNNESNKLIDVSDEEDEEDEEEDDEEYDEDDEEDDEDEEDFSDTDQDESDYEDENINNIKVLKIEEFDSLLEQDIKYYDEEKVESVMNEEKVESVMNEDYDEEKFESVINEDYDEEESLQLLESDFQSGEDLKNEKRIKIDLGDVTNDIIDYKRFTLQKLKNIVIDKGIITDSSKLKKPELLKLLGVE